MIIKEFLINKQITDIDLSEDGRVLTIKFSDESRIVISYDEARLKYDCLVGKLLGFPIVWSDDISPLKDGEIRFGGPLA